MRDEEHIVEQATADTPAVHPDERSPSTPADSLAERAKGADDKTEVRDGWPITRTELLSTRRSSRRTRIVLGAVAIVGITVAVSSAVLAAVSWMRGTGVWWGAVLVGLEFGILPAWFSWFIRKRHRAWATLAPRIWDADGCVCPWCEEDVRAEPCQAHGVGPQHRALLIERHAASALGRSIDDSKFTLAGARPPRGWLARHTGVQWVRDQTQKMYSTTAAPEERRRAWWRLTLIHLGFVLAVLIAVNILVPSSFTGGFNPVWALFFLAPIAWRWAPARTGARRCRRCQHECPDLAREICVECGADLTQPNSTTHVRSNLRTVVIIVPAILIGMFFLTFGSTIFTRLASPGLAAQVFAWTGTPMGYYMDLDLTKMTPAETKVLADLLLAELRDAPDARRFVGRFLDDALAAGLIPESYREQAVRLTAGATLDVEEDESGWTAVITPNFGESVMFEEPRVGVGRVTVDGVPVEAEHAWTLRSKDLDMDSRGIWDEMTAGQPEPAKPYFEPVERLSWRIPLDLPSGEHRIEARCWIVLEGPAHSCLELDYDDEGAPILSDKYHVYELILSETIVVP